MKKSFILAAISLMTFQLVSCDVSSQSKNTNDSEVLLQIGRKMMDISIDKTSKTIVNAMAPVDASSYKLIHAFPGIIVYWTGLLEQRSSFDCTDKIIKFDHNIKYASESQPTTLGIQVNFTIDKENDEVYVGASQGANADDFRYGIGVKVNYDFETKTVGDYIFCRTYLDETHKIQSGTCYAKTGAIFEKGDYSDAECAKTMDDLMDPFVKLIPTAMLADGDEARNYMTDYCNAGDYYKTIGGEGVATSTVVD